MRELRADLVSKSRGGCERRSGGEGVYPLSFPRTARLPCAPKAILPPRATGDHQFGQNIRTSYG